MVEEAGVIMIRPLGVSASIDKSLNPLLNRVRVPIFECATSCGKVLVDCSTFNKRRFL